jgi:hypothetical protein
MVDDSSLSEHAVLKKINDNSNVSKLVFVATDINIPFLSLERLIKSRDPEVRG